jgi:hypothetical protein
MSAQEILIAHGEKALVLLVTAACGYALYGTFTNPEIRPTDISMEKINEMVGKVEKERGNQAPPVMKAPSNYLDDMTARWAVQLPSAKYFAWLGAATDVGPPDVHNSQYYIYEIHPPKVSVTDAIGNLDVTVELPASQRSGDVRISDASTKTWSLEGRADNKAQWLGLQIEFRVGAADWQPFNGKDVKKGLLSLKDGTNSYTVSMPTVEPWQRHHFRARLIAKATGLPLDTMKASDQQQTILVSQGAYADPAIDWAKLQADIAGVIDGKKEVLDKFLKGSTQGAFSEQLRSGELLYRSSDSDEATVLATDSIRFVFDKVNVNPTDPAQTGATLLLTKYLRDPRATDKKTGKWMEKPFTYKLAPGEALGAQESILDPFNTNGQKIPVDLSTAYVLTSVKEKVKRVVYYEIFAKSRPMGGKAKDLEVNVKEIETEIATLSNTKTGTELSLPRCERVTKPNKPLSIFYPDFPGLSYDEAGEFKKNPAGFKQNQLVPKAPVKFEPGTGPLEDLHKRRNDPLLQTDTPYYELPDGRIVYWEGVNHKVVVLIKPGSEAAADAEAAAKEAAEKEAAEKAKAAADAAAAAAAADPKDKDKASKEPKDAKDAKPAPK